MARISILLVILMSGHFMMAQNLNVAIFYNDRPNKVIFKSISGCYALAENDSTVVALTPGQDVFISLFSGNIMVQANDSSHIFYGNISIKTETQGCFSVTLVPAVGSARIYDGNLYVRKNNQNLLLVNNVPLENYVAAVTEAEGGYKKPFEFYKAQAVISRTFALKNIGKHQAEGFELCDGTHCQAYKSKSESPDILRAVQATSGLVIVDENYALIMAAYHSNSGGITMNSEDVWISSLSYLKPVEDKYYVYGRNAVWQQTITADQWKSFLKTKGVDASIPVDSSIISSGTRIARVTIGGVSIPMTEIRHYFRFPSAFFSMSMNDAAITVSGRGYGHGVGLSQESAVRMAEEGFAYNEILNFFYKNIYIVNMQTLSVFKVLQNH
ncbi:MAG TPA: SpoIID/LytB domain-containing protein [Bacteroidales bacterium]|nr:SpoIID/LytB domain-containing protein [Bacteroidales bacterium]HQP03491.1 SpoIID/LytB domain-containing protein [Bacteroidales bacterium]